MSASAKEPVSPQPVIEDMPDNADSVCPNGFTCGGLSGDATGAGDVELLVVAGQSQRRGTQVRIDVDSSQEYDLDVEDNKFLAAQEEGSVFFDGNGDGDALGPPPDNTPALHLQPSVTISEVCESPRADESPVTARCHQRRHPARRSSSRSSWCLAGALVQRGRLTSPPPSPPTDATHDGGVGVVRALLVSRVARSSPAARVPPRLLARRAQIARDGRVRAELGVS